MSYNGSWKTPLLIADWEDFRPESLSRIYDGQLKRILDLPVSCPEPPVIASFPFCEIHDEASLEGLLTLWSQQIVSNALAFAQDEVLSLCASGKIYMARGGQAELLKVWPKNDKARRSHPDWAAVKRASCVTEKQLEKPKNVLPGDTKLSSKWRSSMVPRGDQQQFLRRSNTVNPVIQVFNYCLKANARYGFIITDQELVVLRVGVAEPAHVQDSQDSQSRYSSEAQKKAGRFGKVELASIPWDHCENGLRPSESLLTVNLALWWLHLLAGMDSGIEFEYSSLAEEKLPTISASFSAGMDTLDLAAGSFSTWDDDRERPTRKKRRLSSK